MRTPGADRELAAGFLFSERVLATADDLGVIEHCTDPDAENPENIVNVTLANGSAADLERILADRRQVTTSSSCGLCGRRTIESLRLDAGPLSICALDRRRSTPREAFTRRAFFRATAGWTTWPRMSAVTTRWTK